MAVQYSKTDIDGFMPGQQFRINATMQEKGFFQVLLENGAGSEMLHFSVNIDPPGITYTGNNSIRNWSHCWHLGRRRGWDWLQDTIATGNDVPIKLNQKFTLILRALKTGIEITIDGKPVFTANGWNESELRQIKQLKIKEKIVVHNVEEDEIFVGKTIENPAVPAKLDFSALGVDRGFGAGKMIRIIGIPNAPKRFHIDLVEEATRPCSDHMTGHNRHFHFNPRFDEKKVVRNNLLKDKGWQKEERDGGFPFAVNKQFVLDIVGMPENKIKVIVDEKPFCEFGPRGDLGTVDRLEIYDSVEIKSVSMSGGDMFGEHSMMPQSIMFSSMQPGMTQIMYTSQ